MNKSESAAAPGVRFIRVTPRELLDERDKLVRDSTSTEEELDRLEQKGYLAGDLRDVYLRLQEISFLLGA